MSRPVASILLRHLARALDAARAEIDALEAAERRTGWRVMGPGEAAEYLGISESELRKLTKEGAIPHRRYTEHLVRYSERALIEHVEGRTDPQPIARPTGRREEGEIEFRAGAV